jgi:hypothetical protein
MSIDIDGYGFSEDDRNIGRLVADIRVMSPSSIERAAAGWDSKVGDDSAAFEAAEKMALDAIDKAGRWAAWDEVRRSLFGLTEVGTPLLAWQVEHGPTGHKAERAALAAAVGLLAADLIDQKQVETLVRPMAEALPWLLPAQSRPQPDD